MEFLQILAMRLEVFMLQRPQLTWGQALTPREDTKRSGRSFYIPFVNNII